VFFTFERYHPISTVLRTIVRTRPPHTPLCPPPPPPPLRWAPPLGSLAPLSLALAGLARRPADGGRGPPQPGVTGEPAGRLHFQSFICLCLPGHATALGFRTQLPSSQGSPSHRRPPSLRGWFSPCQGKPADSSTSRTSGWTCPRRPTWRRR